MEMNTRIAPSPTGSVHIGTLRTLYHNWLGARSTGGKFIFRIDDTDLSRSESKYIDPLFRAVDWLGLDFDHTFKQSNNFEKYRDIARQLVEKGAAIKDDGCIRLNPEVVGEFSADWEDSITGVKEANGSIMEFASKQVLIKSDESPVYNFANVIDDINSGINWVIRGVDHINNTYKQALIYRILNKFLGFEESLPKYSHVGLVCHTNNKKLSKRDSDAMNIQQYDPDAVLNYILRLGWSPKVDNKENSVMDKERAREMFVKEGNLKSSNAKIDLNKLSWYNKIYTSKKK